MKSKNRLKHKSVKQVIQDTKKVAARMYDIDMIRLVARKQWKFPRSGNDQEQAESLMFDYLVGKDAVALSSIPAVVLSQVVSSLVFHTRNAFESCHSMRFHNIVDGTRYYFGDCLLTQKALADLQPENLIYFVWAISVRLRIWLVLTNIGLYRLVHDAHHKKIRNCLYSRLDISDLCKLFEPDTELCLKLIHALRQRLESIRIESGRMMNQADGAIEKINNVLLRIENDKVSAG